MEHRPDPPADAEPAPRVGPIDVAWLKAAQHWDRDRRARERTQPNDPVMNRRAYDALMHRVYALGLELTGDRPQDDQAEARVARVLASRAANPSMHRAD